jgi:GcrA cell cycle regulator
MDWTDENIARFRVLWDEGHSAASCARFLGCSKNAAVGKAHRLNFPPRPSPILWNGVRHEAKPRVQRPHHAPTLAPLASLALPLVLTPRKPKTPATVPTPPTPEPHALPRIPCCWPIGEPRAPGFRFCGAQSEPGKPYCSDHVKRAYIRVRDRREDQDAA